MSITKQLIFVFCFAAPLVGFADSVAALEGPGSCKFDKDGKTQCKITSKAYCDKVGGIFIKEGTCRK